MNEHSKIHHDVERGSNLDLLLRGGLGVANRAIDAIGAIAVAIARASATDPDEIAALTERLKKSHDALAAAVDAASK